MNRLLISVLALGLLGASACSAVTQQYVHPDFDEVDKNRVWRVHVVTAGMSSEQSSISQLWALIAQRWVNQHRDYIAKQRSTVTTVAPPACQDGINGLLVLKPHVERLGDEVRARAAAALIHCEGARTVWSAKAAGTWDVEDDVLKATTAQYASELGPQVRPWVPATFRLLRELLDTMPRPKLKDDDAIMEKIDLEE